MEKKIIFRTNFILLLSANFYNSTERTQQCCEQRFGDSGEEEHSCQKDERGARGDHKQTRHNTNFVRKWSEVRGSRCRWMQEEWKSSISKGHLIQL